MPETTNDPGPDAVGGGIAPDGLTDQLLLASPDAVIAVDAAGTIVVASPAVEPLFGYRPDELLGKPVEILISETVRNLHVGHRTRYLASPATRPMGAGSRLLGRRRDGTLFPIDVSLAPVPRPGGVVVGAFVRDATDWVRAEQRLSAVNELTQALLGGEATADILAATARHARELVDARASWIVGRTDGDADDRPVTVVAGDGAGADKMIGTTFAAGDTAAGQAMAEGRVLLLEQGGDALWDGGATPDLDLGAVLLAPMATSDRRFGTLVVARTSHGPRFEPSEVALVELFAASAAVALKLGEARDDLEQFSLMAEHDRIARDLHDTVIQRLFATGMSLQGALSMLSGSARERVAQAVDDLDATITEIRTTIFGLRHASDDPSSLRARLLALTTEASGQLGFHPRLAFDGPVDIVIGADIADQLVPVLREALSNVARHASARSVDVVLSAAGDTVLTVLDDGVGPSDGPTAGHGLRNMSDRARAFGGTCFLTRRATGGSRLEWRVPAVVSDGVVAP